MSFRDWERMGVLYLEYSINEGNGEFAV